MKSAVVTLSGVPVPRNLVCLAQALYGSGIDPLCHAIKIDKKAQKDLIRGGTIFVYPAEVA